MQIKILSWNIQYTKGADGKLDLKRQAEFLQKSRADIICLQEVGRHLPDLFTTDYPDQLAGFCEFLPEYTPIFATGLSWCVDDKFANLAKNKEFQNMPWRLEMGNLTLIKKDLKIVDYRTHTLPLINLEPFEFGKTLPKCTNRACNEICIEVPNSKGDFTYFRLFNLHLAYHNQAENLAQLEYINTWQKQNIKLCKNKIKPGKGIFSHDFLTDKVLICGDFNTPLDSKNYNFMLQNNWQDAWQDLHSNDEARPATCGIFDSVQWQEGAHSRDFFMQQNLRPTKMQIDTNIDFSDHQTLILDLEF